jgi:hypothetical protein
MSTKLGGVSHWFNRVGGYDVDLTGDQFGFPTVQLAPAERLYSGARPRAFGELNAETLLRAQRLAERAGLSDAATGLGDATVAGGPKGDDHR